MQLQPGFDALSKALPQRQDADAAILLSTGPSLFQPAIAGLQSAGLTGDKARIGLEKPLGQDLASFHDINDAVLSAFPEERTFRIDHYLGKETVQNLLALRFGNRLFEQLWNAAGIEHIQITVAETVGLEGRGGFYDEAGALRDMVQNHMLQLLALVAMEPPAHFNATEVRDEKVKVLRSLRPIDRATAATHSVIGQYGWSRPRRVCSGLCRGTGQALRHRNVRCPEAYIDNWRWKGFPSISGPASDWQIASPKSSSSCDVPHSIFESGGALVQPNKLIIRLNPRRIACW